MSAGTVDIAPASGSIGGRRFARIVAAESKTEFLKFLRLPSFVVPTVVFPLMFYVLFALAFGGGRSAGPVSMAAYMIATYGAFGVMGAAFGGLGIGIAVERGQGWLTVKRASPMPSMAYFLAKMAMAMMFAAIIVVLLSTLGAVVGDVRMPAGSWALLLAVLVLGAIPFCAIGCTLGFAVGPNAAPAVANLVFMPMAFASGLWIPLEALPKFFHSMAPFLPAYHLARIALAVVGADRGSPWPHVAALTGFTVVFTLAAAVAYRRDDDRTYG
jgi:ABC-2 type transport system permease protein